MLRSDDAAAGVVDLSDAVTVFVTTVGAPTFAACMAHLQAQDCRFTLRLIEYAAPMNVAFQRMLDECTTPYYVQVDEDMLLEPHAVRTLYERIEATSPRAAMFIATLFDAHLDRCIIGVKIYRHDVVRRYPYVVQDSFESDQVRRIEADGYPIARVPITIEPDAGRHARPARHPLDRAAHLRALCQARAPAHSGIADAVVRAVRARVPGPLPARADGGEFLRADGDHRRRAR